MVDMSWIDQKQTECDALRGRLADVEKERDTALDQLGKNRISTHSERCHTFGPKHYDCLMRKFTEQSQALAKYLCPIGMPNGTDICSAGTCPECFETRAMARVDEAEKARDDALALAHHKGLGLTYKELWAAEGEQARDDLKVAYKVIAAQVVALEKSEEELEATKSDYLRRHNDAVDRSEIIAAQSEALAKAKEALKSYEEWEADLILSGDWGQETPVMTQAQFDDLIIAQNLRNAALASINALTQGNET